jgi:hypothetical protein
VTALRASGLDKRYRRRWAPAGWARGTGAAGPCVTAPSAFRPGGWPAWSARTGPGRRPASRYWAFQWYETAIFAALALLLAWFCFWVVRRRVS